MKASWLTVVIVLFAGITGFVGGIWWQSAKTELLLESQSSKATVVEKVCSKSTLDEKLDEISRLQSLDAKERAINETMSRLMKLFVANLGLKLSNEHDFNLNQYLRCQKQSQQMQSLRENTENQALAEDKSVYKYASPDKAEYLRRQVTSSREHKLNVEDLQYKQPDKALFESRSLQEPERIESLMGRYKGLASVDAIGLGYELWSIQLELSKESDQTSGEHKEKINYVMKVYRENSEEPFSSKKGTTDTRVVRDVKVPKGDPEALLFVVSPTMFLQVYWNRSQEAFLGNLYQRDSGKHKFIGTATLKKSDAVR